MQMGDNRHWQTTLKGVHNVNIPIRQLLLDENNQLMQNVRLESCTFADLVKILFNDPNDQDTTPGKTTRVWPQASTEPGYKIRVWLLIFNLCNVEMNQEGASWLKKYTTHTTTPQHDNITQIRLTSWPKNVRKQKVPLPQVIRRAERPERPTPIKEMKTTSRKKSAAQTNINNRINNNTRIHAIPHSSQVS